ncbi:MAG TPA: SIMPL domain-containing protein [Rhizomicrobium sp.]|nr:SIMPL domain-containing protein [Rhizomicrobium sp.]
MRPTFIILQACFAACLAAAPLGAAAAKAEPAAQLRILTVSGEGDVKAVPDRAMLTAGVQTQAAKAADALAANRHAMNAVFAELKKQGIPDRAMQTSSLNINPQYDSSAASVSRGPGKIVGYQVYNGVTVTIDDLGKLGATIDALVSSGANSMGGISFSIRDPKPLLRQARDAAVKDAIDRAQLYAKSAGVALGRIQSINEGSVITPRPMFRAMMASADVATPIAAGEETVSAQVSVTFEIK